VTQNVFKGKIQNPKEAFKKTDSTAADFNTAMNP
jgi:hypothetical protein